jgi:hypothetical protein
MLFLSHKLLQTFLYFKLTLFYEFVKKQHAIIFLLFYMTLCYMLHILLVQRVLKVKGTHAQDFIVRFSQFFGIIQ